MAWFQSSFPVESVSVCQRKHPPGLNVFVVSECVDLPGWKDKTNATCADYADNFWCNPDGSYGDGWGELTDPQWGTFASNANANGIDATEACCACGKSRMFLSLECLSLCGASLEPGDLSLPQHPRSLVT